MGFRNPITTAVDPVARSLANQALTEIIPGSRLAADAIDGMTITGATVTGGTVQSAGSGARAQFIQAVGGRVPVYRASDGTSPTVTTQAGGIVKFPASDTDATPAQLWAPPIQPVDGGGRIVRLDTGSPDNGTTRLPSLQMSGGGTAGTVMATRQAVFDNLDALVVLAPVTVNTPTAAGHAATKGYVDGLYVKGTFSGTTDTNGRVAITHGLGAVPSDVDFTSTTIGAVDTNAFALVSVSSTTFVVQLYYNGAVNKSAAATFNWRAWK